MSAATIAKKKVWTDEELEALPKNGSKHELLDGGLNWQFEQVHIYKPDSIEALTQPNDILSGGDVLPGFKCRLSRIFHFS